MSHNTNAFYARNDEGTKAQRQLNVANANELRTNLRAALHAAKQNNATHALTIQDKLSLLNKPRHLSQSAGESIFINYKRHDEIAALDIALQIRDSNLPVWMDVLDIDETADWNHQVDKALYQSQLMLIILSPEAIADAEVRRLYQHAYQMGKIIIPIKVEACDTEDFYFDVPIVDVRQNSVALIQDLARQLIAHAHA